MARRLMAGLAPAALLVACTDSYPTIISNDGSLIGNDEVYGHTPVMMFVNEQSYFSITATRGTGVLDEEHPGKYFNSVFHVFAFRDGSDLQGQLTATADMRRTVFTGSGGAYDAQRMDCLVDGPDYNLGLPAMLSPDRSGALVPQTDSTLYYSSVYQDVGYNFFAYHIDDFKPTAASTHRESGRIWYDLEIDGSQDIMAGTAPRLTRDVLAQKIGDGKLAISADDQARILNIGNYSTFAAHRGVNPVITLKHLLTRLQFVAYPGDESADNIRITGISVEGRHRGRLTVAAHNADELGLSFYDGTRPLELREASDGVSPCPALDPEGYVVHFDESMESLPWSQRPALKIGESLMLAPDSVYTLTLNYSQVIDLGNGRTEEKKLMSRYTLRAGSNEYYFDPATGSHIFRPGYFYRVNIVVYGLQDIEVSANVEGWIDGGDIDLDPDESEDFVVD